MVTITTTAIPRKTPTGKPWHIIRPFGWTDAEFRAAQSIRGTISAKCRRGRTAERDKRIRKQVRAGVLRRRIANEHGLSVRQIHRIANRRYQRRPIRLHPDVGLHEFLDRHPHLAVRWKWPRRFPDKCWKGRIGPAPLSTWREDQGNGVPSPLLYHGRDGIEAESTAIETTEADRPHPTAWRCQDFGLWVHEKCDICPCCGHPNPLHDVCFHHQHDDAMLYGRECPGCHRGAPWHGRQFDPVDAARYLDSSDVRLVFQLAPDDPLPGPQSPAIDPAAVAAQRALNLDRLIRSRRWGDE